VNLASLYPIQVSYTLLMLIITSIFDIKSREVPEKLWIPFAPLAVFTYLELHYVNLLLFVYSVVVSVALLMVMTYVGLMGGADVVLILLLGLGNPVVMPIFFPRLSLLGGEAITVVLYTSLIITLVGLYNTIRNWKYTKDVTGANRFLLAFSGKRMTVSQFLNSRFYFPLTEIDESGRMRLRTTFRTDEDDAYWRKKYAELLERGVVNESTEIWVTWGVPVIPFFLIAYVISLVVGLPA